MKTGFVILLGVVGAAALGTLAVLGADDADSPDRLRVAYFANVGHLIPIVGMEKGFFEQNLDGIDIQTRVFDSGPQAIEAMFANSIDLAYVGPGPAINGHLNSKNIQILAGAASGGASFVIQPDSQTPFDFDGKKIGAPQIGNTQDVSLRNYLSQNGLSPAEKGGSVIIYNIPNPDIYTLFVKGDIDGAWIAEPWATILEQELGGQRLFYEEEQWPDGEFASVLLVANTDYVKNNPKTIQGWLDAHKDTVQWIKQNKKETGTIFNDFLQDYLGRGLSPHIIDIAISNITITADPIPDSVKIFASRADNLGYLGRNGYNLAEIFYIMDSNASPGDENS